jgi:uracil phosphoribosyltransferase
MADIAATNPMAEVLSSRAITMLFTIIREKSTTQRDYVTAADRLMAILAEEGLARVPCVVEKHITTPCGTYTGLSAPPTDKICCVDIVRSGGILLEAVRKVAPDSKTAKILIQRDEQTAEPKLYYSKLPENIKDLHVVLCDPMLATGGSAMMAIDVLKEAGVKEESILFINVVSCPEGLKRLAEGAPGVKILTAGVDTCLNEAKFIVPGLGDFGDRYYGTAGYAEGLWGTDGK